MIIKNKIKRSNKRKWMNFHKIDLIKIMILSKNKAWKLLNKYKNYWQPKNRIESYKNY